MGLHEARVAGGVVRRRDADAAAGFLEDDGEDEARVCVRLRGNGQGGVVDGGDLFGGVGEDVPDCAGAGDEGEVGGEPVMREEYVSLV